MLRLHRPTRVRELASPQSSQIFGPNSEETAPEPLTRIGAHTEVPERICFVTSTGPTAASCERSCGVD